MNFPDSFKDATLLRKLMFIAVLATVGATVFALLILTVQQWFLQRHELEKSLNAQASIVAMNSASALLFNDRKAARQTLEGLAGIDNIEYAGLYDLNGLSFASFVRSGGEVPHHRSEALGNIYTMHHQEVVVPVVFGHEQIGTIHVLSNLRPVYDRLWWNMLVTVIAALAALLVAVMMLTRLLPVITDPLLQLVGLMNAVSQNKNYALRAKLQSRDELGMLAQGFNEMLAQIQKRDATLESQRDQLEEQVRQRTAKLTEAQHIAHLGNWEWDIASNRLEWSDEVYLIFGSNRQYFEGTYDAFVSLVHNEDRQMVMTRVHAALENNQHYSIDHRIVLPDGAVRYVHEQAVVLRDDEGVAVRMRGTVQDITERKLAEEAIRQQQALTTKIIETIPMRVFWKDRDSRYLGCNSRFAQDAGLNVPEELIGKTDFELGWKDQAEIYRIDDRRVMDSNSAMLSYDEPQTTPSGGLIWLRTSKVPLRNEADETIGLLGIYEDITPYKQMELRLQESEMRFRLAFQYSAVGMALVGLDGRWLKVNDALCQIVGYSGRELLDKTFQDITHPDDLKNDLDFVAQLIAGQIDHYQMEKRYIHKDGHVVWIRLSVSLIRDLQDQPIHFVSQIEDITERKLAEEKILESEARYRGVFEYADDIIYLLNADGTFISLSPSFERMTGWQPREWIGKPFAPILHPDDLPYARSVFENALAGQSTPLFELRIARKSGGYFDSELSIVPVKSGGKIAAIGIARDITERKRAEEEIQKLNDELESKVEERTAQLLRAQEELVRREKLSVLGQVAGSVGHELRNPLGVMNNAVYFLQTVLSDADETTREYLNIIKAEIASSERIVSDLLDSVRTKPPHLEIVGAAELIGQTLRKLEIPPCVSVRLDIPSTLLPLRVDGMQIHQVLRNLICNGVEAMPDGGTLTISASEHLQEKTVTISVRDSGIGMTQEQQSHLFQPLFTTKARGIGLGLVVVKNLTQVNGGRIEVRSSQGVGTTFELTLPAADERGISI